MNPRRQQRARHTMRIPSGAFLLFTPKTGSQMLWQVCTRSLNGYFAAKPEPDDRVVTFCRNPYDRAVSIWFATCRRAGAENDKYRFIRDSGGGELLPVLDVMIRRQKNAKDGRGPHGGARGIIHSQVTNLSGWLDRVDRVIRFERLEDDLAEEPWFEGAPRPLPRFNTTIEQRKPWQDYMTPEVIQAVHEWAGEDFDTFGYERLDA